MVHNVSQKFTHPLIAGYSSMANNILILMFTDESLSSLMDHLRINSSSDIGSMIVSEAGQGHVDKLKELLKAHPDKVG